MKRSGIVLAAAIVVGALAAAILCAAGVTERGMHLLLRTTAITSLVLFLSAFVASSLRTLRPSRTADWLVENRRYLGLSFALSHVVHLAAIIGLVRITGDPPNGVTIVIGGLGYVFLFAMAATSSDTAVAWLGARRWKVLHTIGANYLWLVFALTLLGKVARSPIAAIAEAALVAAMGVRLAVRMRRRATRELRTA